MEEQFSEVKALGSVRVMSKDGPTSGDFLEVLDRDVDFSKLANKPQNEWP